MSAAEPLLPWSEPVLDLETLLNPDEREVIASALSTLLGTRIGLLCPSEVPAPADTPLVYQCETAGYLRGFSRIKLERREAALRLLRLLLAQSYRLRLTLDAHEVSMDLAYQELLQQHQAVTASEERYRALCAELDGRVSERTRELGEAQMRVVQAEKLAALGRLAAGVAHEINTPIGFVRSNLQTLSDYLATLLAAGGWTAAAADPEIEYIRQDAPLLVQQSLEGLERMARIVAQLKDFSRVDASEIEDTDLNRSLETTLAMLASAIPSSVRVVQELSDLPCLRAVPRQLHQAFLNLILNGLESMPGGGTLRIATRADELEVIVEVSDTGAGIPEENLARIFEPFFTTKEVGRGAGLGLSVAHDVVSRHGGTVDVRSRVGAGSTFTLRLPRTGLPERP